MFADVIIPLALPKNYTWSVPQQFREQIKPGIRVEVGLGKSKKYAGIVKSVHQHQPGYPTKDILNLLDTDPVIHPVQLKLWEWIAGYYMCTEGEVMAAALPAHFKLSSESVLIFNEEYGDDFSTLDHEEYLLAEALLVRKEITISESQQLIDNAQVYPVIKRMIEKKVCFVWEALKDNYIPKKETYILLHPQYTAEEKLEELLNNWGRAPKQMELLLAYLHISKTVGEVKKTDLLKKSGASDAQLKGLIEKNILVTEKKRIDRINYLPKTINIDFNLTALQQQAYDNINLSFSEHPVCLLHGVTSSGKTLVYIKQIEKYIKEGKQVLYLLPEIALTSQIIRRLEKHFGGNIGIYHSKFNQNERIEIWNKIKKSEVQIILGARSALFLPFADLGLVIIDEEHDQSYKQQDLAPRYNARDAAIYYASLLKTKVLLGSATPAIDTYFNAINNKYGWVELKERYGGYELPSIHIIDTKTGPFVHPKEKTILTEALKNNIDEVLAQQKQVILFQNRRGYSPYQICRMCGFIPHCRHCDVTLTFHKKTNKLHCHYCGQIYPLIYTCPNCGSDKFVQRNFGTEKIEEQLEEIFPDAHIARMDVDSVRGKHAHDQLIQTFEQGKIDILVGTQMIVKGLDFGNVELVGILDADSLLNFADFRVNERAFQLMEQVSGRAGRQNNNGKVLIQVSNTKHPVLQFLKQHDYKTFYNSEIEGRKRFAYPPFSRIILLTFKHISQQVTEDAANFFAGLMSENYKPYIVGPAEPVVNRIRNQYLSELLIKLPKDSALVKKCKQDILQFIARLHAEKKFKSVIVIPDVDR